MANEHTILTQMSLPVTYLCADATGIEKGALLAWVAGGNTVAKASVASDRLAGVAYTEKRASDGNTTVAVITGMGNEFKAYASGSISRGDPVGSINGNFLRTLSGSLSLSGAVILGHSTEDCTTGQTFKYVMNIQTPAYAAS